MTKTTVTIAAGCSLDTSLSLAQAADDGGVDYVIIDYMMEHGSAKMAAARDADPDAGFAAAFLEIEVLHELPRLLAAGTRIIASAGGLEPLRCAELFRERTAEHGLSPRIAVVHGDDVRGLDDQPVDMFTGAPVPSALSSSNVYLGAVPIAQALRSEPDIVITGRVVDSALALGPLLHEFGWDLDDYDRLAAGSLAGHLLECGAHSTGGIHTDWRDVDFAHASFLIADVDREGGIVLRQPDDAPGILSVATISEQLTYEIGDPQRYLLPDVTLDSSAATVEELPEGRLRLSGAKGYAPTSTYKVCAVEHVGWSTVLTGATLGEHAGERARKTIDALSTRAEESCDRFGWEPFTSIAGEVIGEGRSFGGHVPSVDLHEAVYRIVADHARRDAAEALVRWHGTAFVSMAPGTCFLGADVKPRMKVWSFLLEKSRVSPKVTVDGVTTDVVVASRGGFDDVVVSHPDTRSDTAPDGVEVPLARLALTRSGDKGDTANIGVVARRPQYLPFIASALTAPSVRSWFGHLFPDAAAAYVERYEMPGIGALNFVLRGALGGGAVSSRRFDDMGKGLGQQILEFPVRVPASVLQESPAPALERHS